ncbi:MAG: haloacid dehalogenase-like hydrolase [Nostocaceae cyanobacterium]|nr:haloacid dehalogenase-like hydrolase [Nostocaceae cyanobacterium]
MNTSTDTSVNPSPKNESVLTQATTGSENYLKSIEETLETLNDVTDGTPVIVDFDETLLLRNSTEEYLNSLQPRAIAVVLLLVLEKLKPWSWLPGIRAEARDWLRVVLATLLFPWTLLLWQKRARELAETQSNLALITALKEKPTSEIIVATLGFYPIVKPILAAMPLQVNQLIGCRLSWGGLSDRLKGKLALAQQFLTPETIQESVVITDSTDDNQLLAKVAHPCLVKWPEAVYQPALAEAYLPFLYLEKAKRPGENYFARVVLYEDWLSLVLATSWVSQVPLFHALSMLFLMLSFWCIYEVGYIENDRIAEKYEAKPKLSPTYQRYINRYDPSSPWIWAIFFAIPGLMLLNSLGSLASWEDLSFQINPVQLGIQGGLWIGLLLAVRWTYHIYNFIDVQTRLWLYPLLQLYKGFGFLLVTATSIVGAMSFAAYVVARWTPYLIYRRGGDRQHFPEQLMRCILFLFFLGAILVGTGQASLIVNGQAGIILAWLIFRARYQIWEQVKQVQWIK